MNISSQGKFAKVSDHRFDFINQWKWFYGARGYAVRNTLKKEYLEGKQTIVYMHKIIHPSPEGFETDHEDTDTLNNQDKNLRTGTHQQNMMNQSNRGGVSKYKGVCWNKHAKKWNSKIMINYKRIHLGYFDDEIEAAKAYDQAAIEYQGEFANLNLSSQ